VSFDTDTSVGLFMVLRQASAGCAAFAIGSDAAIVYGDALTTLFDEEDLSLDACALETIDFGSLQPVSLVIELRAVRPGASGGFSLLSAARHSEDIPAEVGFVLVGPTPVYVKREILSYERVPPMSNRLVGRWEIRGY
jgi:hypothetical protein